MTLPYGSRPRGPQSFTEKLFYLGGELAYIVTLSAAWLIASIPIVTIPAATAAVYGTIGVHVLDGGRAYVAPFKAAFRGTFRRVLLPGLLLGALAIVTAFNSFYYLRVLEGSGVTIALGVLQLLLASAVAVVLNLYLLLAGLHHAREYGGATPRLRDAIEVIREYPKAAWGLLLGSVALPVIFVVAQLWQFGLFVVGGVCYANIWLLLRLGVPALRPEN